MLKLRRNSPKKSPKKSTKKSPKSHKKSPKKSHKKSPKKSAKKSRKSPKKSPKKQIKRKSKKIFDGCTYKDKEGDHPMFFNFDKINDSNYNFWFKFASDNLEKDNTNQGIQGFNGSLNLYNLSEFKNVIYVAFITDKNESIKINNIEMAVIVFIEKNIPFSTHMGIFRNLFYDGYKHKNISLILHSYAACETLKINKDVLYMVTKPVGIMSKILLDKFMELKLYDKIWFGDKLQRDYILSEKNQLKYQKAISIYNSLIRILQSTDKISLEYILQSNRLFNIQIGRFIKDEIIYVIDMINTLKINDKSDVIDKYIRNIISKYIRYIYSYYLLSMNQDRVINSINDDIINIEIYPDIKMDTPINIIYKYGKEIWIINDKEFVVPSWFIKNPLIFSKTEELNKIETIRMCIIDEHTLASLYFD